MGTTPWHATTLDKGPLLRHRHLEYHCSAVTDHVRCSFVPGLVVAGVAYTLQSHSPPHDQLSGTCTSQSHAPHMCGLAELSWPTLRVNVHNEVPQRLLKCYPYHQKSMQWFSWLPLCINLYNYIYNKKYYRKK